MERSSELLIVLLKNLELIDLVLTESYLFGFVDIAVDYSYHEVDIES
jgi:hypothetical protein